MLAIDITRPIMDFRYTSLVQAVDGYNQTGISLVAELPNQTLIPAGFSDDVGIYYFIPKLASYFNLSPDTAIDYFFILILGVSLVLGLIGLFLLFKNKIGRLVCVIALTWLGLHAYTTWDVYVVSTALPIATVPYLLLLAKNKKISILWLVALIAIGIAAGTGNMIRSHAGTPIIIFFVTLVMMTKGWHWRQKIALPIALIVGFALPLISFGVLLNTRDTYLRTHQADYAEVVAEHPLWHSVYIGFGFLNNSHGITYSDEVAIAKVQSVAPGTVYLSKEYETILKQEVFGLARTDAGFFLRTIAAKLGVVFMYLLIFSNLGLFAAVIRGWVWQLDLSFGLALVFAALFGVLVIPTSAYLAGFNALAVLYGAINLNLILDHGENSAWAGRLFQKKRVS